MFAKILIANRGEIAVRIIRACRELGIATVSITSEADADQGWARLADEKRVLPGFKPIDTYLNQDLILAIAVEVGVDAIHPGYGFLSENARFAEACINAGVTFIGPDHEIIRAMGDKATSRTLASRSGIPVVPGLDATGLAQRDLLRSVRQIGFPVLVKATAGGGGKGMRIVESTAELLDSVSSASKEATSAFGDGRVLIEKYYAEVHHVEVQILADTHGNCLHLFERECSIQRRHQKIIEESPSPTIDAGLRRQLTDAAVSLARAVNYTSAGTVEFIVAPDRSFYFLEMNTRLQVEHPVTETITGVDLVAWQIRIAAGEQLDIMQADLVSRGSAIECRLYAEDPANFHLPSTGEIQYWQEPQGPGIRVDAGIALGDTVTPYYDPLLAKLISWGRTRNEARLKMLRALRDCAVVGVVTNLPHLRAILDHPEFIRGQTPTRFLETNLPRWQADAAINDLFWAIVSTWELVQVTSPMPDGPDAAGMQGSDPWTLENGWRNVAGA